MDDFKKASLIEHGMEMTDAREVGKHKLLKWEKKYIRKLSRARLKQRLK